MDRSRSRRLLLGAALALVLFAGLFVVVDWRSVARSLADAQPPLVGLAAAAALTAQLCWSLTTTVVLEGVDGSVSRRRVQVSYLASSFARQLLPLGNLAGSAILTYIISEDTDRRFRDVFAAVTASELIVFGGSVVVAGLGLAAMLLGPDTGLPAAAVVGLLAVTALLLVAGVAVVAYRRDHVAALVARTAAGVRATVGRVSARVDRSLAPDRVGDSIDTFLTGFGTATASTRRLVAASALSVAGWVAFSLALVFGLGAVGVAVPVGLALFLTPASGVVMLLPTPGGLGSTEVGLTAALTLVLTVPPEAAAAGVLVYRLASYWLVVAVGGLASLYLSTTVLQVIE